MRLIVTEKKDAAEKIADLLSVGKPKEDKVYSTPVYRFSAQGQDCVTIGLRGHILEPDFVTELVYKTRGGWFGLPEAAAGETDTPARDLLPAHVPQDLPRPPFATKRKPFTATGVDLKGWKMDALPYLVYAPIEKLPKEKDIIRSLKTLAKKADSIVIATDFDREGELIGADALSCIREVNATAPAFRARYSAFTKEEITEAFSHLVELDENLASAGATRQDIDLVWGAVLTRYLTLVKMSGFGNVRSSGRVQTPTLALIVARERERQAFVPEDYWVIKGEFATAAGGEAFSGIHATARFTDKAAADAVMAHVAGAITASVVTAESRRRTVVPPAPFNTTSLMAAAAAEGITPARTMRIAESLYMRGLISYPRVDNTVYPDTLDLRATVSAIAGNPAYAPYCATLLARPYLKATRGKQQTTDHPPIYPTAAATPGMLDAADYKLYNLIARRFLATLSDAAEVEGTTVNLDVAGEPFVAKGDVLVKPGFRAIYPYGLKADEQLPALQAGQVVAFNGAACTAKQTEPPARYSQGKLIQEMEKLGLGTKSTRHAIIERLIEVKYVANDPLEPSALGMAVCDALDKFAPHITHPEMTADLEAQMDNIAGGKSTRVQVVENSRDLLAEQLRVLMPHSQEVAEALRDAVAADAYVGTCPKCGKALQVKTSGKTAGSFIGCSGWPECDATYPLPQGKIEAVPEPCPKCGMPQVKVIAFRTRPRTICIDPACVSNYEPEVYVGLCPTCKQAGKEAKLFARRNPKTLKRSIRCENYDECATSYPLPQNGKLSATEEVCESCGAPIVVVTTARGPWKLCPNFSCPSKAEQAESAKAGGARSTSARRASAKTAGTRAAAKKTGDGADGGSAGARTRSMGKTTAKPTKSTKTATKSTKLTAKSTKKDVQ